MIIEVSRKEYYQRFESKGHPFISEPFIKLNEGKVEKVVCLIEDSNKSSIGLVAGIKNGLLITPFSAPFGGFHYDSESIYINEIDCFVNGLKEYVKAQNLNQIIIILPPAIYQESFNAKIINTLILNEFIMDLPDITSWVELRHFNDEFSNRKSRGYYQQAIRNQLIFRILDDQNEKKIAYELIAENRSRLDRPIFMSYCDIERSNELWPVDFFGVFNIEGDLVASGVFYKFPNYIAYGVFWGDSVIGRPLRAMDFLVYNIWSYYKKLGLEYIDLGISTKSGIPNVSLLRFKETHNCTSNLRFNFHWNCQQS